MISNSTNSDAGYEKQGINARKIATLVFLGVVTLAIILYGLDKYFVYESEEEIYEEVLKPVSKTLIQLEQRDSLILNSYGINDSLDNVYRIPIDSAMQILLRESSKSGKPGK